MTLEDKALIADFLKWEKEFAYTATNNTRFDRWLCPHTASWIPAKYMKFDIDWNWLMKAVIEVQKQFTYNLTSPYDLEKEANALAEFLKLVERHK